MILAADLERYIGRAYGGAESVIVRDRKTGEGLRSWNEQDTAQLCDWIESRMTPAATRRQICHNIDQAAEIVGVGAGTIRSWISREPDGNPLPHIRDGRRIIIPHFMLIGWLRSEAGRTRERQTP